VKRLVKTVVVFGCFSS